MSNAKYYIDKEELWNEIRVYYEADDANREAGGDGADIHDKLGMMINDISEKLMTSRSFSGYPYKDQMVGDAILRMVKIITERKFNLFSPAKSPIVEKRKFKGTLEITTDIPEGCLVARGVRNDENGEEQDFFVMLEPIENRFHHYHGKPTQAYKKAQPVKAEIIRDHDTTTQIFCFVESGRQKKGNHIYTEKEIYDENGELVMQKNNAFGYLSLISNNEAITRIKRENKNYEAVHQYQEQEFTKFLSENPEMAPQRIFDDTYEIDQQK